MVEVSTPTRKDIKSLSVKTAGVPLGQTAINELGIADYSPRMSPLQRLATFNEANLNLKTKNERNQMIEQSMAVRQASHAHYL